jgi:hypothetical protein
MPATITVPPISKRAVMVSPSTATAKAAVSTGTSTWMIPAVVAVRCGSAAYQQT